MKKSRLLVLVLAAASAGGAFLLANGSKPPAVPVEAPVATAAMPVATDEVLTASRDLPIGTVVADGDFAWQPWPKAALGASMLQRSAEPKALDDAKGSIVRNAFYAGEPMRHEKLIKGSGSGYMSTVLPSGMRAVAINIDAQGSTSAGGFILPNDHVDVIHTFAEQMKANSAGTAPVVSETLLRNVRVLAIGQNVQDKNGQSVVVGSNATLELDPVQAETVVLAQRVGQLSLALRSVLDASKTEDGGERPDKTLTVVRYGQTSEGEVR